MSRVLMTEQDIRPYDTRPSETPEQFRIRKMQMLREDIAFYARRLNFLRNLGPGSRLTGQMLVDEIAYAMRCRDECSDELIEFAKVESQNACDRASGYGVTFRDAAAAE